MRNLDLEIVRLKAKLRRATARAKKAEAELATDSARLDKLADMRSFEVYPVRESECAGDSIYIVGPQGQESSGKTLRSAIDAIRKPA